MPPAADRLAVQFGLRPRASKKGVAKPIMKSVRAFRQAQEVGHYYR
jgi:hypothetical protein